jgi:hypothetical protein
MSKIRVRKGNVEDAPHVIIYYCKSINFNMPSRYLVPYHTWSLHKWTRHKIKIKICAIRAYKTEGKKMIEGMYD